MVQQPFMNQTMTQQQQLYMQQPQQYMQQPQQYMQQSQQFTQQPQQYMQHPQPYIQYPQNFNQPSYPQNQMANQPTYNNLGMQQANTPVQYGGMNQQMSGISLSSDSKQAQPNPSSINQKKADDKVNWLSSNQKGLIDFSDFSSQIKKGNQKQTKSGEQNTNNIEIDMWNW